MKRLLALLIVTVSFSCALDIGQANSDIYRKEGAEIVLSPGSVNESITSITWKHGRDDILDWGPGFLKDYGGKCKLHCVLNTMTGELTISDLTIEDSGNYTTEINRKVLKKVLKIRVISAVPTPSVNSSCEKTRCVLICEVNTKNAEPVTYYWRSGDKEKSRTKELIITKEETATSFICLVENPVSSNSSKQVDNPFITSRSWWFRLLVVLIPISSISSIIIIIIIHKYKEGKENKKERVTKPVQESSIQDQKSSVHPFSANETECEQLLAGSDDADGNKVMNIDIKDANAQVVRFSDAVQESSSQEQTSSVLPVTS